MISLRNIERFVEHLLLKSQIPHNPTQSQLNTLIEKLGGHIKYEKLDPGVQCILEKTKDGNFIIILDKPNKFNTAHALGHLFIHMEFLNNDIWAKQTSYIDIPFLQKSCTREELEANVFAYFLIMGRNEFIKKAFEFKEGNKCNIDKMEKYFNIPKRYIKNHGETLGVFCLKG